MKTTVTSLLIYALVCLILSCNTTHKTSTEGEQNAQSESTKTNGIENKEEQKSEDKNSIATPYKIIIEASSKATEDFPLKAISLQMPNQQILPITAMYNCKEVINGAYGAVGLPEHPLFVVKGAFGGYTQYCYGVLEEDLLSIFSKDVEEDGSQSDVDEIKRFQLKNNQWTEVNIPQIKNANDYRNQNWQPENGKYFFSKQYIYTYYNEYYPEGENQHQGNFSFYIDEVTGTILLTRYDSFYDEMTEYVIVHPNQDYIVSYSLEHSNHKIDTIAVDDYAKQYPNLLKKDTQESFAKSYQLVAENKTYGGDGSHCIKTLNANTYSVNYEKTNDKSEVALAPISFDATNLYLLGKSDALPENGLKIPLHQQYLPGNLLLVEENATVNGKTIQFSLDCISVTNYFVDLFNP